MIWNKFIMNKINLRLLCFILSFSLGLCMKILVDGYIFSWLNIKGHSSLEQSRQSLRTALVRLVLYGLVWLCAHYTNSVIPPDRLRRKPRTRGLLGRQLAARMLALRWLRIANAAQEWHVLIVNRLLENSLNKRRLLVNHAASTRGPRMEAVRRGGAKWVPGV